MKVGPDAGKYCMDVKKSDMCSDIRQDNFPPKGEPALSNVESTPAVILPFLPTGHRLQDAIDRTKSGEAELVV